MGKFKKNHQWKVLTLVAMLTLVSLALVFAIQKPASFHGVGVLKSAEPLAAVGDTVTYRIKAYNPSDFDLYNINVTDDLVKLNTTISFMAAHNETGITYIINRTVLMSDPDPLINTVSVKAVDSEGLYSSASTQAKTTIVKRWIDLKKTGPEFAHEGDSIKYTIAVTNLANISIPDVTVKDEMLGFSWTGTLSVGESDISNVTYVVPTNAEDPLTNTVTVYAKVNELVIYAEATWTVDILNPKLEVDKTVKPRCAYAGDNVTYTIVVTNAGDATLYNLTLVDSINGEAPPSLVPPSLNPEDSFVWSFNASVCKSVLNVATATGVDALGKKVSASDCAFVKVEPVFCPRSIGYWKNHPETWPVDEIKVGNATYTKEDAVNILKEANSKDATKMLAAQLIAAKLDRLCGAPAIFCYCHKLVNIENIISNADSFLANHPIGSNPQGEDREAALWLKNALATYNDRECDDCVEKLRALS